MGLARRILGFISSSGKLANAFVMVRSCPPMKKPVDIVLPKALLNDVRLISILIKQSGCWLDQPVSQVLAQDGMDADHGA